MKDKTAAGAMEFRSDDITKNDITEIVGFIQLFRTTYMNKVHTQKISSPVH